MSFHKACLALGALGLLSGPAMAAEEFAKGMAVAREIASRDGQRFVVTARPPADRGVDPRVFDLVRFEESGATASEHKDTPQVEGDALDLSGYRIRIEALAASSCSIQVPYVKFGKVSLGGGKAVIIDTVGAASVFVSVYPTKGDVDALTTFGPDDTICNLSEKNSGQFDFAKCFDSACNPSGDLISGWIHNPLPSQAQFVGSIAVTFAH